ncbi:hypothetical protein TrVE_jg42 [Triparma verrucosa]|uniref:Uncharacterized protein n=1 Tax=Triparma verrucosa TaxID=1606542 RepID=A0A9W7FNV4_9STRA|nr:hypothetical protein TrVE_jg42 [Triparma verrucosa]
MTGVSAYGFPVPQGFGHSSGLMGSSGFGNESLQSSHLQFSASLGDDSSLSLSQDFSISKTHDWRVHHKSRQGLRSRHSRSGTTPATPVRPKINIEAPKLAPPEGQRSPLKGLPAEDAPSIVISSLASMDNDHDYNYLKNYSSDANGKPMTAKDRARHGMLRTMLRKSLEVTRPNWPKHPNMRSTDRILDEERGMLQKESILKSRGGASGGVGLGLGWNVSESLPDLQALARKPVMSMSPEFKKIYNLNGSGGGSPQSNNNSYSSPNNRSNNQTLSPTMRAGAGRTIGTFGIGPEGGGGTSMIRSLSDAELRKQFYGSSKRLPSPSARNLELLREKELKTSLKIYARPATTSFKFLGEGSRKGSKGLYGGSKTNTVKIHRGVRISKQP